MKKCEFAGCKENAIIFWKHTARCKKHPYTITINDTPLNIAATIEDDTSKDSEVKE